MNYLSHPFKLFKTHFFSLEIEVFINYCAKNPVLLHLWNLMYFFKFNHNSNPSNLFKPYRQNDFNLSNDWNYHMISLISRFSNYFFNMKKIFVIDEQNDQFGQNDEIGENLFRVLREKFSTAIRWQYHLTFFSKIWLEAGKIKIHIILTPKIIKKPFCPSHWGYIVRLAI